MLGISLNNSKIQNIKKENSMKNIKDNNLNQNQALKVQKKILIKIFFFFLYKYLNF